MLAFLVTEMDRAVVNALGREVETLMKRNFASQLPIL
jgi:hypothetical protein